MSQPLYIALDQGGHASRALVFDQHGGMVTEAVVEVAVSHGEGLRVEHDAEQMVDSVRHALVQALGQLGERRHQVHSIGLATQRSSIACWDRHTGQALSPIISWQDRRTAQWIQGFEGSRSDIHESTGLFLTAHYGASKLRWCLDHLPAVRQAYQEGRLAWGPLASFLVFRLLQGHPLWVDPANASRTLLWNCHTLDWDPALLQLFGVPRDPLPACVPTRFDYGSVEVQGQLLPLTLVNGDQSAALFAFGRPDIASSYVNVGTGAFVQRVLGASPKYAEHLLTSVVLQDDEETLYVLEGTVNGSGSALLVIEAELGMAPEEVAVQTTDWLARDGEPPLFLNGISGLGAPYWVADFPSRFIGEGEDWQKIVAVLESIVFLIMENLSELDRYTEPSQRIVITGGLTVLAGLCQRLADLSCLPVYRPAQCEATARGTAFLQAGKPRDWPEPRSGTWFQPQDNPKLQARYQRWRHTLRQALDDMS